MDITKTFVLQTTPAVAWDFLTDPRRVASCLPGAAITAQRDDRSYDGTITVKVGPVSATYRGTVRFDRLDPAGRTAELTAAGQDVRGKGGAEMRMTSRLVERAPGQTEVTVRSELNVMGVLAQFGRGMIQDVSDQMFQRFVDAMRRQLEAGDQPNPAEAGFHADKTRHPETTRHAETTGQAESTSHAETAEHAEKRRLTTEAVAPPGGRAEPAAIVGAPDPGSASANPPSLPPIDILSMGSGALARAAWRAAGRREVQIAIGFLAGFAVARLFSRGMPAGDKHKAAA